MGFLDDFGGSIISAGASLYEGSKNRDTNKKLMREQMTTAVQRRVEDAKKAGIHPLFALGASVGNSPVSTPSSGIAAAGEAIGRGFQRRADRKAGESAAAQQNKLVDAQVAALGAQAARDNAAAFLDDSRRARLQQDLVSQGHDRGAGDVAKLYPLSENIPISGAKYEPPTLPTSKRAGVRSGTVPGTIDVMMPDGRIVNIYSPDLGMDEISQVDMVWQRAIHKGTDAMMAVHNYLKRNQKAQTAKRWLDKLNKYGQKPVIRR